MTGGLALALVRRPRERRKSAVTAPAESTVPVARSPIPNQRRSGTLAPMLTSARPPAAASAFMTTTDQLPLRTGHASVCLPAPLVLSDQNCCLAGARGVAVPG